MHGNMSEPTVPKSARGPHANRDYKMVVLGHRAVGKSALVVRFLTNRFISEYQENSEMTCDGVVEVDSEKLHLQIQDTSEKGIRVPTVDHHFQWADAIMLVYSVTDKLSYQKLYHATKGLKEKLTDHETLDDKIPTMVVVGNKGDLDHMRQVKTRQGMKLANELGCEFYETSASEGWSKNFNTGSPKHSKHSRRNGVHELQRPHNLPNVEKTLNGRRKSDPAVVFNTIFGIRVPAVKSPENDLNNNGAKSVTLSLAAPAVPHISISPSEEVPPVGHPQSRGRKLMQKLSPRFSRKFGSSKPTSPKRSAIGASLAKISTAGLAVGAMGRERCNTLPTQGISQRKISTTRRVQTLQVNGKYNGMLLDSASSSSSSESLSVGKDDVSATFFLRPETPTSDCGISSSEDEFATLSDSTITNGCLDIVKSSAGPLRRSRSICRDLNLQELLNDRRCNSDSDSSKRHLFPNSPTKRGRSDTRLNMREMNTNFNSNNIFNSVFNELEILHEKKFNASEPFKHLCREARTVRRQSERITPTKLLRDGIRKIKTSFASDQAHQNSYQRHYKNHHFHVTAGGH